MTSPGSPASTSLCPDLSGAWSKVQLNISVFPCIVHCSLELFQVEICSVDCRIDVPDSPRARHIFSQAHQAHRNRISFHLKILEDVSRAPKAYVRCGLNSDINSPSPGHLYSVLVLNARTRSPLQRRLVPELYGLKAVIALMQRVRNLEGPHYLGMLIIRCLIVLSPS